MELLNINKYLVCFKLHAFTNPLLLGPGPYAQHSAVGATMGNAVPAIAACMYEPLTSWSRSKSWPASRVSASVRDSV